LTAVDPTTESTDQPERARSRRDVLCGLAVALIAPGALVACSSESGDGGSSGGGGGGPTPLADIPDGGGLVVDNPTGGKALLVRNGQQVTAYNAACTHMGTIVDVPKDGVSTCPNHGSQFAVGEAGKVLKGPATKPLRELTVEVKGDQVVLT
jgi:cytochrome b6-f complex iron-sulfur subunit